MSIRSVRSTKFGETGSETFPGCNLDFEAALCDACMKYNCPYTVYVKKVNQQDEFLKRLKSPEPSVKYKKITVMPRAVSHLDFKSEEKVLSAVTVKSNTNVTSDILIITAVYDNVQNLVEITLNKIRHVPRALMQIMNYLFSPHEHLTKLTFNYCSIDAYVMHELNKIITLSTITDINFDRTILPNEFLSDLLNNRNASIKYLSLCGCEINDEICRDIATTLRFTNHAEKMLTVLNLSSNRITDEGAKHLGEALRTNRHLRYLNLADNHIHDEGTISILNSLMEYPLTNDEVRDKRRKIIEYLTMKTLLFKNISEDRDAISYNKLNSFSRKSIIKKKKTSATSLRNKVNNKNDNIRKENGKLDILKESEIQAKFIANELTSPFLDPFSPQNTKVIAGQCYCLGNIVLCYLNLSYNKLMYPSLKKIVSVMQYQRMVKKFNQTGLIKVVIEGNTLPTQCDEYQIINNLTRIGKSMVPFSGGKISDSSLRKKRPTLIIRK